MKIGINATGLVQSASVDKVEAAAREAQAQGFSSFWLAEHPTGGFDALTVLALVGRAVPEIELGTAIVPTHPRHPMVLAGQTLTAAEAIGGRLTLGVGLSHAVMMESLGISFEKPIRHLKEYLSVLVPLCKTGEVDFAGETLQATGRFFRKPTHDVEVLVAALGPQALAVTGRLADGTNLAWVGPKTIASHIVPRLGDAAAAAGRPVPRVLATLPVCVTDEPDEVRSVIGKGLKMYSQLPSYQAMFEREGVAGPAELSIVGGKSQVEDGIQAMAQAGVTDFAPSEFFRNGQEREATRDLLRSMLS